MPDWIRDLLRGGLPTVLDLPPATQTPGQGAPFTERFQPVDGATLPRGRRDGPAMGLSNDTLLIGGGLLLAAVAAAVVLSR